MMESDEILMYGGVFNQNVWLRSFLQNELIDEYERKCLDHIHSLKGQQITSTVAFELFDGLAFELWMLGNRVVEAINHGEVVESVLEGLVLDDNQGG